MKRRFLTNNEIKQLTNDSTDVSDEIMDYDRYESLVHICEVRGKEYTSFLKESDPKKGIREITFENYDGKIISEKIIQND